MGMAEQRARPASPPYTLVFVAYDGEEVALYGGYDYLRKHQYEGMLAVVNFEIPAAETDILTGGIETLVAGVATSKIPVITVDPTSPGRWPLHGLCARPHFIARKFGGIIPTDIQGTYRSGFPTTSSTASSTPWYHTRNDTPDKVDTGAVVRTVNAFSRTTDQFLSRPVQDYRFIDASLWTANVQVASASASQAVVNVGLAKADGTPLPNTTVRGTLFCDDFFAAPDVVLRTDAQARLRCLSEGAPELQGSSLGARDRWPRLSARGKGRLARRSRRHSDRSQRLGRQPSRGSEGSGCVVDGNCCAGNCVQGMCKSTP